MVVSLFEDIIVTVVYSWHMKNVFFNNNYKIPCRITRYYLVNS